jgi:steroid 5-alpha reductase family enzyme
MKQYLKDFLIFLVIYDVGFAISALLATQMTGSVILQLLYLDIIFTILIFIGSLLFKNSSLYDPYWSVVPPMLMAYALLLMDALTPLNIVVLIGIFIWALRLTYNWTVMWDGFKHQDWRYTMLKEKTGSFYPVVNFLGIHLFPTLIVFAQIAVYLAMVQLNGSLNLISIFGVFITVSAVVIQYFSDEQMRNFKRNPGEKRIIDVGLWQYSRHPNYFGEVMVWWGLYIAYFGVAFKVDWYILAPISMTLMFLFISIPMMEEKILKTRSEYRLYQADTSKLIPWFKKKSQ